jgi:hypothetical protein
MLLGMILPMILLLYSQPARPLLRMIALLLVV